MRYNESRERTVFDITAYAAIRRLIDAVERVGERLTPNERETLAGLAAKYAEPVATEATDATCLEVILRNVEIRKGYRVDPAKDAERVIEPTLTRGKKRR